MKALSVLLLSLVSLTATANDNIVGRWKSIDDETGKAKSLIEVKETDGVISGNIIKLFNPSKPNPICEKCSDDRKDQDIIGMEIIRGVSKKKKNKWAGGKILDPKKGKEYSVKFTLKDEGKTLKVRGYIGSPMIGRTQIWERVE